MGIYYNEDTEVLRDDSKFTDYVQQTEQQIKGLSANQSDRVTNRFSYSSSLGVAFTATESIILTTLTLSASAVPPNIITVAATINGETIADLTSRNGTGSKTIPLPNWILREGDILDFVFAGVGDAESEFIGYYA